MPLLLPFGGGGAIIQFDLCLFGVIFLFEWQGLSLLRTFKLRQKYNAMFDRIYDLHKSDFGYVFNFVVVRCIFCILNLQFCMNPLCFLNSYVSMHIYSASDYSEHFFVWISGLS